MLKITRPVCPPLLAKGHAKWTDDFMIARAANSSSKFSWRSKKSYQQMREALLAMTLNHCAFYDGIIGIESLETVEHFQPKKHFPALAYTWGNLFPCCNRCQEQKGEKYNPALLKPDDVLYDFEHFFVCNDDGSIEPSAAATVHDQERAQVTIDLYGLNLPARKKQRRTQQKLYRSGAHNLSLDDLPYRFYLAG